jgi:tRNA-splicing endonuclease subunit Sen2
MTSEEITAKRRAERKQFKVDRARAIAAAVAEAEAAFAEGRIISPNPSADGKRAIPSAATWKPQSPVGEEAVNLTDDAVMQDEEPLEDVEHLQLTLPEALFLSWNLDCLTILNPSTVYAFIEAPRQCIQRQFSAFQNEPMTVQQIWPAFQSTQLETPISTPLQLDNPFLINYIVYHHYRSLGWVVKGGVKFCVDYVLYKRGPVFHHAEYDS